MDYHRQQYPTQNVEGMIGLQRINSFRQSPICHYAGRDAEQNAGTIRQALIKRNRRACELEERFKRPASRPFDTRFPLRTEDRQPGGHKLRRKERTSCLGCKSIGGSRASTDAANHASHC